MVIAVFRFSRLIAYSLIVIGVLLTPWESILPIFTTISSAFLWLSESLSSPVDTLEKYLQYIGFERVHVQQWEIIGSHRLEYVVKSFRMTQKLISCIQIAYYSIFILWVLTYLLEVIKQLKRYPTLWVSIKQQPFLSTEPNSRLINKDVYDLRSIDLTEEAILNLACMATGPDQWQITSKLAELRARREQIYAAQILESGT